MSDYNTEQEKLWAGEFGNEYLVRNRGKDQVVDALREVLA